MAAFGGIVFPALIRVMNATAHSHTFLWKMVRGVQAEGVYRKDAATEPPRTGLRCLSAMKLLGIGNRDNHRSARFHQASMLHVYWLSFRALFRAMRPFSTFMRPTAGGITTQYCFFFCMYLQADIAFSRFNPVIEAR